MDFDIYRVTARQSNIDQKDILSRERGSGDENAKRRSRRSHSSDFFYEDVTCTARFYRKLRNVMYSLFHSSNRPVSVIIMCNPMGFGSLFLV